MQKIGTEPTTYRFKNPQKQTWTSNHYVLHGHNEMQRQQHYLNMICNKAYDVTWPRSDFSNFMQLLASDPIWD